MLGAFEARDEVPTSSFLGTLPPQLCGADKLAQPQADFQQHTYFVP
jgi:hypothetical protein